MICVTSEEATIDGRNHMGTSNGQLGQGQAMRGAVIALKERELIRTRSPYRTRLHYVTKPCDVRHMAV